MFDDDWYYYYRQYRRANYITGGAVPFVIILMIFFEIDKFIKRGLIVAAVIWLIWNIVREWRKGHE